MIRKPPKRAGESRPQRLSEQRMAELAEIVVDDNLELGPQDAADLVEALRELVDRRHAEALIASLTIEDEERSAA